MDTQGARYKKDKRGFSIYTRDDKKKALAIIMSHDVRRNGVLEASKKMEIPMPTLWHWAASAVNRKKRNLKKTTPFKEKQQVFEFTERDDSRGTEVENDLLNKLELTCRKLEAAERAKKDLTELLILAVKMFNEQKT